MQQIEQLDIDQPTLAAEAFKNRFSIPALRVSLNLSAIAYEDPPVARIRLKNLGWNAESVSVRGVDCYVCNSKNGADVTAVAFRGSQPQKNDWVRNVRMLKTSCNGTACREHRGYHSGWGAIAKQVVPLITGSKLLVVGHSAGGGLARSMLLDFFTNRSLPPRSLEYALYSFGAPKTLSHAARELMDAYLPGQSWRVTNNVDAVSNLGFASLHCGQLLYLSRRRCFYPPHNGLRLLVDKIKSHLSYSLGERVKDHLIPDYARAVQCIYGLQGTDLEHFELARKL